MGHFFGSSAGHDGSPDPFGGVFIPGQTSPDLISKAGGIGILGGLQGGGILQRLLRLITIGDPPEAPEPSARRIVSPEGLELAQLQARRRGTRQLTSPFTGISIEDF